MKQYKFLKIMLIALVMLAALPAAAQEETGPSPVGLRPDAPTYALHGPYWVGTREFVIEGEERPLPVTVWYPALNPTGIEEEVTYTYKPGPSLEPFTQLGDAIANASPNAADGPFPLVIVSHGNVGYRYIETFLTEHLASYGFVVMAVDHIGNTTGYGADPELTGENDAGWIESTATTLAYRPGDVQRQIDYAANLTAESGALAGMIDVEHVGVAGHSYGGFTALAAAGARIDYTPVYRWCDENAADPQVNETFGYIIVCAAFATGEEQNKALLGIEVEPGELWPAYDVKGVDAIVPMAPSGIIFKSGGAKAVTVPTLFMGGSADNVLDPAENFYPVYADLTSEAKALVIFENAGHGIFANEANDWMNSVGWYPFFSDPVWDMDRAHDLTNHFTTAFLLDVLKGDPDAHTALLAENVSFPGITYETTLK